ncbi:hypothetical protein EV182_001687 [Spiromyces aspiralis]|uniref:Uncharacterized protein n=1 Tax=Spiromyces aspiralis TaxID=68401 RepID=A0ACC1HF81_9FUNG|nr:hypothetical protein EV182_001687 [Spiromyces aspiralis]
MPLTVITREPELTESEVSCRVEHVSLQCESHVAVASIRPMPKQGALVIYKNYILFFDPVAKTGFTVDYPSIIINGVKDNSGGEGENRTSSLYIQLDGNVPLVYSHPSTSPPSANGHACESSSEGKDEAEDEDEYEKLGIEFEFSFKGENDAKDTSLAISECMSKYYSEEDADGSDTHEMDALVTRVEDPNELAGGEYFTEPVESGRLSEQGRRTNERLNNIIIHNDDSVPKEDESERFEDAKE